MKYLNCMMMFLSNNMPDHISYDNGNLLGDLVKLHSSDILPSLIGCKVFSFLYSVTHFI